MSPTENQKNSQVIQHSISESKVATITLSKPERRNALAPADWIQLAETVDEIGANKDVRVVILHGDGGGLSSGLDLKSLASGDISPTDLNEEFVGKVFRATTALRSLRQPLIAVNAGAAVGAAVSLFATADFRLATADSLYSTPFANLGLVAGDLGLSWLLPRLIGPTRAARVLLTGEQFSGQQGYEWGLITELSEAPLARAQELALLLTKKSRFAVEQTKRLVNEGIDAGRSFEEHFAEEIRAQTKAMQGPDFIEGIMATLQKREPNFG